LGRGVGSGDFNDDDDFHWAELTKPILLMSNFTARAKRLSWIRTNSQINIEKIDTSFAKVEKPNDPVFTGLNLLADNIIPYTEGVVYPVNAHKDSVGINGEVVLSLAGIGTAYDIDLDVGMYRDTLDMAEFEDIILMARWMPGDSMYTGKIDDYVAAVPAGHRSYITVGGETFDYDANRQARKYYALTDVMNQVFLNEVERLLLLPVPPPLEKKQIMFLTHNDWVYYPETGTEPASGHYADSLYVADLRDAGYDVIVPNYEDYKTLGQAQIDSLINVDLIILGRGVGSGDFNDDDDYVWEELGTPIMLMSNFTARAKRLSWIRTNSQKNISLIDTCFAKVENPNDPVFSGLDIPADNVIPYTKDVVYPLVAHKDSVGINGEVVLSIAGINTAYGIDLDVGMVRDTIDMAELDDFILMARWTPGDSMYTGKIDDYVAAVPAGYRSYITVGGESFDYDANRQARKYYALTDFMKQAWLNEVARMVHLWMPSEITPPLSVDADVFTPDQYSLKQNYPNPFNPETKIMFHLAKPGRTTIKVYNILGQKVMTLMDKKLLAGPHTVTFDGKNFTSGMYFYKIESGDFTKVRKMMLMK
ncbi:T9SS type A sorting domain-containing protein, partial [candidate division KSB1 bacterium]|nr:T9SS type A sorting domain-containing protein [candidate division KSB1 bacterium]